MVVLPISIHAPTRGATACEALAAKTVVFQSTLPRGERRMGKIDTSGLSNFNPRSHEGSDNRTTFYYLPVSLISIHAPTRGATYCICRLVSDWTISIHAPTRGATPVLLSDMVSDGYFNPRSHEGSDYFIFSKYAAAIISIHAPTRGATQTQPSWDDTS